MDENLKLGDTVHLKKVHPCGGFEWEIVRIGADIKIKCMICNRLVMLPRSYLEKKLKTITYKPPSV